MKRFINIHFDNIDAPNFFSSLPTGVRKIGIRYGDLVLQFRSAAKAKRSMLRYRAWIDLNKEGERGSIDHKIARFAYPSNCEGIRQYHYEELSRSVSFFKNA